MPTLPPSWKRSDPSGGGYTVNWTGVPVLKRDGTPHHGVGVIPTVPVSPTVAGIHAGRDEVLERAISLVTGRKVP